ncbi:ATP synthase F0F1 [Clostridium novyi B str. ATCC 27606]|uniref:ATP synthase F0F1 n=2 Tax=Clostridium TaxID=1485 RepID=A0AA40IVL4_CLONO|nr:MULTISPECIES: ATP synthase subunit I [Clostridium]KEI12971.1 ATP synthase F0F1 [Clostridium novyi B str. NCTC 9691]KEI17500.1 ATP synthase F0F1 [Clostridium haemolyticum NCTC 9693]KEI17711.1 ATP synthase F0F1 [Clostridium novyi B str. ATCC 27606]KGN04258.1 ATP synthase F0F1 [Clostridium haemolyticum NCTC 8350]CAG7839300.1 hypothetical protein CLOHAE12215_00705 [Clostridium haemolyticum]
MNKHHEVYNMIKKIKYLDIVVLVALSILSYSINKKYVEICILGFVVSAIGFYWNSLITTYAFKTKLHNSNLIIILNYYLRIFLITIIGIVVFTYNKFNIIAYIVGYTFRFFSLILYALILKK